MIEIYQYDVASFENDLIEAYGDSCFVNPEHARKFAAKVAREIRDGSKANVEPAQPYYKHVATVDADDLDEAFELTNLWNDEDRVERKARMHSTSIGDVLKTPDGIYHMVDRVGFKPVWA
tara:strand:- start:163 stop:522 length:360 start_codon:yes stop_codon:yes gene_type:complete